jgi:hypothetical protein
VFLFFFFDLRVPLGIPAPLRDCSHELTFTDTAASLSLANKSPYSTDADGTTSRQGLQALLSSCLRRASSFPTSSNLLWAGLTTDKHSAWQQPSSSFELPQYSLEDLLCLSKTRNAFGPLVRINGARQRAGEGERSGTNSEGCRGVGLAEIVGCSSSAKRKEVLDDLDVDEADISHHVTKVSVETRSMQNDQMPARR